MTYPQKLGGCVGDAQDGVQHGRAGPVRHLGTPSPGPCFPVGPSGAVHGQVRDRKGLPGVAFRSLLIATRCTFKMSCHLHFLPTGSCEKALGLNRLLRG